MSALYTALVEGETKGSLAVMVCELREERNKLRAALERITAPPDCGCRPCMGQCRDLESENEGMREIASDALAKAGGMTDPENKLWCETCGEAEQTVSLSEAGLCDDCAAETFREALSPLMGYRICGNYVWQPDGKVPAVCLALCGTEHAHG